MSLTELPEINSEQLEKYHEAVDGLKVFLDNVPKIRQLVTYRCLDVAIKSHGGKTALIKQIIGDAKDWKEFCQKELTAEDVEFFEQIEKEEREEMMRDFTPPETNPLYTNALELAKWLVLSAEESDEEFDEIFENIMVNRYEKKVIINLNKTEVEYWQKTKPDDVILGI